MTIKPQTATRLINEMGFHASVGIENGAVVDVSAEHGDDAADYYGEFRGNYPWINPKLERFATNHGLEIEWVNPGHIAFYRA